MKKKILLLLALVLCIAVTAVPAAAYIERGTVHIYADKTELFLKEGETGYVAITLDPAEEDQMPGCGMADCPQTCGQNCLSNDGNCTCDITTYQTYYTEVLVNNKSEAIAEAVYADGVLTIKALSEGQAKINVAARLREYMGSSVNITVTVEKTAAPFALIAGISAAVVVIIAAAVVFAVKKTKKK